MIFQRSFSHAVPRPRLWRGLRALAQGAGLFLILGSAHAQGPVQIKASSENDLQAQFGPHALKQRHTHASVDVMTLGDGAQRVYIFTPAQPALHGKVPMVFFHHGWQGMNPLNYGALIDHLARSGQVVIFPVYQDSAQTSPQVVTGNAAQADRRALAALAERGITPDARRVLYFGYSMGAAISLNLALDPARYRLPAPRALVLAAPGDAYHVAHGAAARSIIGPVENLPPKLPIAILTGAADTSIGLPTARLLDRRLCGTHQSGRLVLMVLPSAVHDGKKVTAGHGSPGAPDSRYNFALTRHDIPDHIPGRPDFEASASLNQLDFYGYWKVLDAMLDYLAKGGALPDSVFGNGTPRQRYLGSWPDGTPYPQARIEQECR